MIVAVFSDVHANLPALETFVSCTRSFAEAFVCLGDVVDYGPWNDECLEIVRALPQIVMLEGNHERLFLGSEPVEAEIPLVRKFIKHSHRHFTHPDWIAGLPESHSLGTFKFVHTLARNMKIYPDTHLDNSLSLDRDYFIGHTHHQFQIEHSGRRIINCGSVGQNRKWIDVVNYALLDTDTATVQLCQEPYPFNLFLSEIIHLKYPEECIQYYLNKPKWKIP